MCYTEKCKEYIQDYYRYEFCDQYGSFGNEDDIPTIDDVRHVGLLSTEFMDSIGCEHVIEVETNIENRTFTYYFDGESHVLLEPTDEFGDKEYMEELHRLNWDDMCAEGEEYYINNLEGRE